MVSPAAVYATLADQAVRALEDASTPEAVAAALAPVGRQVRAAAAVPGFDTGEFLARLAAAVGEGTARRRKASEDALASARAEADAASAVLAAQLAEARHRRDQAGEYEALRQRSETQAALQERIDAAAHRAELARLWPTGTKELAARLDLPLG